MAYNDRNEADKKQEQKMNQEMNLNDVYNFEYFYQSFEPISFLFMPKQCTVLLTAENMKMIFLYY